MLHFLLSRSFRNLATDFAPPLAIILPPPRPNQRSATMSSQNSTLIDDDKTSLPPLIKIPSAPPRHYKSAVGSIEREGEAAEREMADYGGDSLSPSLPPVGRQRAGTGGRRMSRSTTPAFPPLHLVDSAFADAHRARSISGSSSSLSSRSLEWGLTRGRDSIATTDDGGRVELGGHFNQRRRRGKGRFE